jgi:hypothetical protein
MSVTTLSFKEQTAANRAAKQQTKSELAAKAKASSNTGQKINTSGFRSLGNAYLFKLTVQDPMAAYYLKKSPVKLTRTQTCTKFDFEVHPMHTQGYPIYIRMVGNDDSSLMTKFDTKGKSAPQLAARGDGKKKTMDFHNLDKLELSSTELAEMERLIGDNYAFIQYLAEQVYAVDGLV